MLKLAGVERRETETAFVFYVVSTHPYRSPFCFLSLHATVTSASVRSCKILRDLGFPSPPACDLLYQFDFPSAAVPGDSQSGQKALRGSVCHVSYLARLVSLASLIIPSSSGQGSEFPEKLKLQEVLFEEDAPVLSSSSLYFNGLVLRCLAEFVFLHK